MTTPPHCGYVYFRLVVQMTMSASGICKIKPEFVLPEHKREITVECISKADKEKLDNDDSSEPSSKRAKTSNNGNKKLRGQNKSRGPTYKCDRETELCNSLVDISVGEEVKECASKNCPYMHDVQKYLVNKQKDIGESCYNFETSGRCSRGVTCRFGSSHISSDGKNVVNKEKWDSFQLKEPHTRNNLKRDTQWALRKRNYNFDLSENVVKYHNSKKAEEVHSESNKTHGAVTNEDVVKLLQREKKPLNWQNKLVLSPLTTVGNLPFRRICKEFGADVTCGEMAMCSSILQGAIQEWALLKRHESEDIFGVQLCTNNPHVLTRCGQVLQQEIDVDFVDLNLGCPIDLVYRQGGGSALFHRPKVLESCVRSLSTVLDVPVTVKMRTGIYSNEHIAHKFAPKFRDWGASLITIHGRSREQRYTKSADWDYISEVAKAAAPLPVLGNGDILSYEDYKNAKLKCPELAGVMIGRGALIKPWLFTEIKEQKLWDISSSERFEILKKYANYGLEHWGSDNKGVENTRRFMLEWLSFLHRYVPVGLLEVPPQKINERPPFYRGRDDLETLMISTSASDWIKISEMILGPVPENFCFIPKHRANSYK